jgi:hypothetical protein
MASSEVSFATSEFFVQLPEAVIFNPRLTAKAVRLYAALVKFAGSKEICWPGQKTLADLVGCSERYVRTLLRQLVAERIVSYIRGTYGKPNVYRLLVRVIHTVIPKAPAPEAAKSTLFRFKRNSSAAESYSPNNNHGNHGRNFNKNTKEAGAITYMRRNGLIK